MNKKIIEKIINEISLDSRVKDGMFNIEENAHMEALRDFFKDKGIDESSIISYSNRVLEGKYPERQAYNAKGILVTFPTPEYKSAALKKGTHFEKNPMQKPSNIFEPQSTGSESPKDPSVGDDVSTTVKQPQQSSPTNLPISQAAPPTSNDADETNPSQASTTAAPQQTPTPTAQPGTIKEPTQLPAPPVKSTKEKEMDRNAIKTMLKGDDYMLEEVVKHIIYNGAPYLIELIRSKL